MGSLMPGFLISARAPGCMNVPLTNAILHSMPPARSGVASALLNASRELAGCWASRSSRGARPARAARCTRRKPVRLVP